MSSTREPRWWRRPRRPLPDLLRSWGVIWGLAVWGLFGFIGAPLVIISPGPSAGQRLGFGAFALGTVLVAGIGLLYVRRPATILPDYSEDASQIERWRRELRTAGFVEIGRSRRRLLLVWVVIAGMPGIALVTTILTRDPVGIFMFVMLVVIFGVGTFPHVELTFARGPAVRVSASGVDLARGRRVTIAWHELESVEASDNARHSIGSYVVLSVPSEICAAHRRGAGPMTRLSDGAASLFVGDGFVIPSTVDAACQDLAVWLEQERMERSRLRPTDPDGLGQTD